MAGSVPGHGDRLAAGSSSVYWPGRRRQRAAGIYARMEGLNMPYYFFFAIIGLVIGALLSWLFLAEHPFESLETPGGPVDPAESALLARQMEEAGTPIDEETVTKLLLLHGAYVDGKFRSVEAAQERAQS